MARAGMVAVLLPGAFYALRESRKPPVDLLRSYGVPMAVATDCNPGTSPILSPTLMMSMACTLFGLTPEEALAGMTVHAAACARAGARDRHHLDRQGRRPLHLAGEPTGRACLLDRPARPGAADCGWRGCCGFSSPRATSSGAPEEAVRRPLDFARDERIGERHDRDATTAVHIRARRGPEIVAKSWPTEAAVRMLQNNLDARVAEDAAGVWSSMAASAAPRAIGTATTRSSRRWSGWRTTRPCSSSRASRSACSAPIADAPRVLIANSNLVPKWATWEHFNELDRKGLMMYGQMTAGSWIYIGTQGIVQGTYETFVEMGRQHYRRRSRGPLDPDRRAWRHGRRPAAGGGDGRRPLPRHRSARRAGSRSGSRRATSTAAPPASTRRWRSSALPRSRPSSACSAMPPRSCPRCVERGIRPDARNRPDLAPTIRSTAICRSGWTRRQVAGAARARSEGGRRRRPRLDGRPCRGDARLPGAWASRPSITATTSARSPRTRASNSAFDFPGFVPAYVRPLFCRGIGPFRWAALSGDPEDIYRTDAKVKELIPDDPHLHRWLDMARERIAFQGLPARICWVGLGQRAPARPRLQRDGGEGRTRRRRS